MHDLSLNKVASLYCTCCSSVTCASASFRVNRAQVQKPQRQKQPLQLTMGQTVHRYAYSHDMHRCLTAVNRQHRHQIRVAHSVHCNCQPDVVGSTWRLTSNELVDTMHSVSWQKHLQCDLIACRCCVSLPIKLSHTGAGHAGSEITDEQLGQWSREGP